MTVAETEILCPLRDYDLRAVTEPRCPECGYAFTIALASHRLVDRVKLTLDIDFFPLN